MDELDMRIATLSSQGFHCSQIMMLLADELRGVYNPERIRALGGLGGGMFSRKDCGTLTGACAVIASYGAKGEPDGDIAFDYKKTCADLVKWFETEYGSVECMELAGADAESRMKVCPGYMSGTFRKCMELITELGIDPEE